MDVATFERIFEGERGSSGPFTLGSPIRYDVWRTFAENEGRPVDLLLEMDITPNQSAQLQEALEEAGTPMHDARVGAASGLVALEVSFETFLRVIVPISEWKDLIALGRGMTTTQLGAQLRAAKKSRAAGGDDESEMAELRHRLRVTNRMARFRWFSLLAVRIGYLDKHPDLDPLGEFSTSRCGGAVRWLHTQFESLPSRLPRVQPKSISTNRPASIAVRTSRETVKADAALRLFEIDSSEVGWAILDSGIDATHVAFRQFDKNDRPVEKPFELRTRGRRTRWINNTRVERTYDLVDARSFGHDMGPNALDEAWLSTKVAMDGSYVPPVNDHGTHVAGILGANWPDQNMVGICPDISLFDIRVLGEEGYGDEFDVVVGLRLVRRINEAANRMVIHGVNLSLSIRHHVRNFACGWTNVCRAAEDLVDSGVVVVAAAGNTGFSNEAGDWRTDGTAYNTVSITDPGNAEKVITVGGTDRAEPYRYGASYFSARGPTADGRPKPDLLAPGQNIAGPAPGDVEKTYDGTSQAAPHVSGAAALILARYPELRGRPERVKEILCETANDLGRDRYFQGHGLVDALRALQSI